MTLFEKIAAGEIPAKIIQEDEDLIVFPRYQPTSADSCSSGSEKTHTAPYQRDKRGRKTVRRSSAEGPGDRQITRNRGVWISSRYK